MMLTIVIYTLLDTSISLKIFHSLIPLKSLIVGLTCSLLVIIIGNYFLLLKTMTYLCFIYMENFPYVIIEIGIQISSSLHVNL